MTIEEYQKEASKTVNINTIEYFRIGAINECGELLSPLKKYLYHNKPIDTDNLKEELGDVVWYIVNLTSVMGFELRVPKLEIKVNYHSSIKYILKMMHILLDESYELFSDSLLLLFNNLVSDLGFELEEILDLNISKLRNRHGEAYNKEFYAV